MRVLVIKVVLADTDERQFQHPGIVQRGMEMGRRISPVTAKHHRNLIGTPRPKRKRRACRDHMAGSDHAISTTQAGPGSKILWLGSGRFAVVQYKAQKQGQNQQRSLLATRCSRDTRKGLGTKCLLKTLLSMVDRHPDQA